MFKARLAALLAGGLAAAPCMAGSQCYGTVANGRLEHAARLPDSGANFSAYSVIAAAAGRTHVHSTVADIVLASYAELASTIPAARFVYGETGLAAGGPFKPHKTHQNRLSVDFFVPVRDAAGKPAILPSSPANHFGYDIEFDAAGRYGQYRIDFPVLAEHLAQLHLAATSRGVTLDKVIIDPRYFAQLYATPRGPYLKARLTSCAPSRGCAMTSTIMSISNYHANERFDDELHADDGGRGIARGVAQ